MLKQLTDALHIRQTRAFIESNPIDIEIDRYIKASDGKGGFQLQLDDTIPRQRFRKVGSSRLSALQERTTADGRTVVPTATLIGMPDATIEVWDKFVVDGVKHEVVHVNRQPPWRVQAEVVEEV